MIGHIRGLGKLPVLDLSHLLQNCHFDVKKFVIQLSKRTDVARQGKSKDDTVEHCMKAVLAISVSRKISLKEQAK